MAGVNLSLLSFLVNDIGPFFTLHFMLFNNTDCEGHLNNSCKYILNSMAMLKLKDSPQRAHSWKVDV